MSEKSKLQLVRDNNWLQFGSRRFDLLKSPKAKSNDELQELAEVSSIVCKIFKNSIDSIY